MAYDVTKWVWSVVGVQGSEYNVLIYLADQADGKGLTPLLPSEKIQRRCNLGRRSVFKYYERLETKDFIKRIPNKTAKGDKTANSFQLNLKRFFPLGSYEDSLTVWKRVYDELCKKPGRLKEPGDLRLLRNVTEAHFQKNSKLLVLITATDVYEEAFFRNLAPVKEAAVSAGLQIRRFEIFLKPNE